MRVPFINSAIILFSVFLTFGISTSYWIHKTTHFSIPIGFQLSVLLLVLLLLIFTQWWSRNKLSPTSTFGILICLFFFGIGYTSYSIRLPKYKKQHFTHFADTENTLYLQLKISEQLKSNSYYHNYIAEVTAVNTQKTKGKLLLHYAKDSIKEQLFVDDIFAVRALPKAMRPPFNPHQFNYANYMKNKGVPAEITLKHHQILMQKKGKPTLIGISAQLRNFFITKLKETTLEKGPASIIQALILGERRDINKDLYNAYVAAGAIHILAVSGLHVGILYFILMWLFRPFIFLKHGSAIRSAVIVVLLWGFAFLAGLSPSVVRAVTMFSFFTLATALNRPTNSFNTLFLSYLLLLLLVPHWLFQVGFQLSYLAVFSILWLQPKLYKLYRPRFYIDKTIWSISTVTIAAQIGIVPLSLYYFHQFPGLFFLTNLVILPVLAILLAEGLVLVLMVAFNKAPDFYVEGYNFQLNLMNEFIIWIAAQDSFLFADIHFSEEKAIASYLVIISLGLLWTFWSAKNLQLCLLSITVFCGSFLWGKKQRSYNELVIFNQSRSTLVTVKEGPKLWVAKGDTTSNQSDYILKGYRTQTGVNQIEVCPLPTYFRYKDHQILVLDSLGIYANNTNPDIVLLTASPRVNLSRLIDSLSPRLVIADGSNYKSYVARWQQTCTIKKLPFHHTGTKGAFTLK